MEIQRRRRRRLSQMDKQFLEGQLPGPSPTFSSSTDWMFVHIPKSAGDSFLSDSVHRLPVGSFMKGNVEVPLSRTVTITNSERTQQLAVLLRNPVSHVLSQFLECKYDTWGQFVTKNTDFPGRNINTDTIDTDTDTDMDDGPLAGFDEWVQHFAHHGQFPHYGSTYAFQCYDPHNMQSRYLTTPKSNSRPHFAVNRADRFPNSSQAIHILEDSFRLVGIVEHYAASLCLLEYHANGNQLVSEECQKCDSTTHHLKVAQTIQHKAHSVPPHSIDMISNKTLALMHSSRMIEADLKLYQAGVQVFERQMEEVKTATGIDLLCRDNDDYDDYVSSNPSMILDHNNVGDVSMCFSGLGIVTLLLIWKFPRRAMRKMLSTTT